jgi:hypothetical protein
MKAQKLDEIYEKPYHNFFMFDLCRFLYDLNKYENSYLDISPFKEIFIYYS